MTRRPFRATLACAAVVLSSAAPWFVGTASAEEVGRIVGQSVSDGQLSVVFRADGLPEGVMVDPESVVLTVAGRETDESAAPQSDTSSTVRRTAVLAIDNSLSMQGEKLTAAKQAALAFLDGLPPGVVVGLVTFGDTAEVAVLPTKQLETVRSAVDAIELDDTRGTALFDAALLAADQTGNEGVRSVLLLTDGDEDGSSTRTLDEAVTAATSDDVAVDAVYIGADGREPQELLDLVEGAGGLLVTSSAGDLEVVFERFAEAISSQLLITAPLPEGVTSGNVVVSATAGGIPLRDTTFLQVSGRSGGSTGTDNGPVAVEPSSTARLLDGSTLPFILGALFAGLLIMLYVALSSFSRDEKQGRVRRRLSIYTLTGRTPVKQEETTALGSSQVARSAVELAGKVVKRRDFEGDLALRLEGAGVPLRPAEWILIHLGAAISAALFALLLSGGAILPTVLGLALGIGVPFGYLTIKESRRSSAFLAQLPDTLQLVAGSLSAGYSMPQAMDTVVREGTPPISSEFNRALVEARLGVPLEDAMEGIAERMQSKDFAWVVMAIRIQREVGGNLSELLTTVAETLRERERLRRQVRVLSAEGRLSAWILGLLPPLFALYLMMAQPSYLQPLVSESLGWLLIAVGLILLAVGVLWMRKAVKVEV